MGILSKLFGATEEKKFFGQGTEEATPPTVRLENPKTGLVVYPKLEKDENGLWQISNPDAVKGFLRTAQPEKQLRDLKRRMPCRHGTPDDPRESEARGYIREVIPVKNGPIDAALILHFGGQYTLLIFEGISRGTYSQLVKNVVFHLDVKAENPKALRIVNNVDTASEAFKVYRDTVNRLRDTQELPPLTERGMAVGLAADFASGLTTVRVDGSELEEMKAKINSQIFPNGEADVNRHAEVIYELFNEKLSIDDCKNVVKGIKALIFISSDKTANRIVPSIIIRSGNKVNSEEAYQAYLYLSGGGLSYSGGEGMSQDSAVVIHAQSSEMGIPGEYAYIEKRYGERSKDWEVVTRFHGHTSDGRAFETFNIRLQNGEKVSIYFDITEFYGKFKS
jgi:hypothetical protein